MKVNKNILKDAFFQFSYTLSFLATWVIAEVFLSTYSWWYSFDPIGFQIMLIPALSVPLYIVASTMRKIAAPQINLSIAKRYGDLIIPILGIVIIFSSLGNDIVFFFVLSLMVISSIAGHFIVEHSLQKRVVIYLMHPILSLLIVGLTYIIAR